MGAPVTSAGTSIYDPLGTFSATPAVARGNTDVSSAALGIGGVQFVHAKSVALTGSHFVSAEKVSATRSRVIMTKMRVDDTVTGTLSTLEVSDCSVGIEKAATTYPFTLQAEYHRFNQVECDPLQTESGVDLMQGTSVNAASCDDLVGVKGAFRFNSLAVPVEVVAWPAQFDLVSDGVSSNVVGS